MVPNLTLRVIETTDKQHVGHTFQFASDIDSNDLVLRNLSAKQIDNDWYLVYNANYVMLCKLED